jgi:hypothetical protein
MHYLNFLIKPDFVVHFLMPIVVMHLYQQQMQVFADRVAIQVDQNSRDVREY